MSQSSQLHRDAVEQILDAYADALLYTLNPKEAREKAFAELRGKGYTPFECDDILDGVSQ